MGVVDIYGERVLRQVDVSLGSICRVLGRAGFESRECGEYIAIDEPGFVVIITLAGDPSNKIWYSTRQDFKARVSPRRRLQLANRINRRNVGTAYVDGNTLCVWNTMSFEGGIFVENIVHTMHQFRELLEHVLLEEVNGELDWD